MGLSKPRGSNGKKKQSASKSCSGSCDDNGGGGCGVDSCGDSGGGNGVDFGSSDRAVTARTTVTAAMRTAAAPHTPPGLPAKK